MKLDSLKTRRDVFKFIAKSTIFGNLGLFVGAGLPMAVMNDEFQTLALSWPQLIEECCTIMRVSLDAIDKCGASYPQIATKICREFAALNDTSYDKAVVTLKQTISMLTSWYPDPAKRDEYSDYFSSINPAWVITTNYDTIIESILTGKGYSLGPDDYLVIQRDLIPVYHLHGIRSYPSSIIITEEDYVALFRPNQYRQQKLPLTIKESVTLLIGYNLGDFNVLSAVDWSENVYVEQNISYPQDIIQLLFCKNPQLKPYRTANNIVILEFDNLSEILSDLKVVIDRSVKQNEARLQSARKLNKMLVASEASEVADFVDDEDFRKDLLLELNDESIYIITGFLMFLNKAIDLTWERARPSGAFQAYQQNLRVLIDTLKYLDIKKMPPALIQTVASHLNSVAYYVGQRKGRSRAAYRTWTDQRSTISNETLEEIRNISKTRNYYDVITLLDKNEVS